MHRLLDRLDSISEEMKGMQHGFVDSEEIAFNNLRQLAQNILKKTYKSERDMISADIKKSLTYALSDVSQIFSPGSAFTQNIAQNASQGRSRRDSSLKSIDLAYCEISKKINTMNTCEIFEFLDTFSKKNMYSIIMPEHRPIRQIPVIVKQIPVVVEPVPKNGCW